MPRLKSTLTTRKRLQDSYGKTYVAPKGKFIDPFPEMHGTLPEKMVYAQLTRFGIPFLFLNDITFNDPEIDFFKTFQADFIIPSIKLIIEVQGARWHSMPKTIEADSYKLAVYESFGYTALAWWDYDIFNDLIKLFLDEPKLAAIIRFNANIGKSGELPVTVRTKVDTSKGIRTLNAKKRKLYKSANRVSRRQLRKVQSSYAPR